MEILRLTDVTEATVKPKGFEMLLWFAVGYAVFLALLVGYSAHVAISCPNSRRRADAYKVLRLIWATGTGAGGRERTPAQNATQGIGGNPERRGGSPGGSTTRTSRPAPYPIIGSVRGSSSSTRGCQDFSNLPCLCQANVVLKENYPMFTGWQFPNSAAHLFVDIRNKVFLIITCPEIALK